MQARIVWLGPKSKQIADQAIAKTKPKHLEVTILLFTDLLCITQIRPSATPGYHRPTVLQPQPCLTCCLSEHNYYVIAAPVMLKEAKVEPVPSDGAKRASNQQRKLP